MDSIPTQYPCVERLLQRCSWPLCSPLANWPIRLEWRVRYWSHSCRTPSRPASCTDPMPSLSTLWCDLTNEETLPTIFLLCSLSSNRSLSLVVGSTAGMRWRYQGRARRESMWLLGHRTLVIIRCQLSLPDGDGDRKPSHVKSSTGTTTMLWSLITLIMVTLVAQAGQPWLLQC